MFRVKENDLLLDLTNAVPNTNLEKIKSIWNCDGINVDQEMKVDNKKKDSGLFWAIQNGHFKMSKMLIDVHKADVNCNVDMDGKMTSILIATMAFCLER